MTNTDGDDPQEVNTEENARRCDVTEGSVSIILDGAPSSDDTARRNGSGVDTVHATGSAQCLKSDAEAANVVDTDNGSQLYSLASKCLNKRKAPSLSELNQAMPKDAWTLDTVMTESQMQSMEVKFWEAWKDTEETLLTYITEDPVNVFANFLEKKTIASF